jgi:hypothetical protein
MNSLATTLQSKSRYEWKCLRVLATTSTLMIFDGYEQGQRSLCPSRLIMRRLRLSTASVDAGERRSTGNGCSFD